MPIAFLDFCDELGVVLEDGQRVAAAIAFDGVQPRDMGGKWRELARSIFGDVDHVPPAARETYLEIFGGRSGKSFRGALRLLHLALTVDLSHLAHREDAIAPIIAPRLQNARDTLRFAQGLASKSARVERVCSKLDAADEMVVHRGKQRAVIRVAAATAGGVSGRGRSLFAADIDEASFLRDKDFKVNDSEIYAAIAPRIMLGGQVVMHTTPWARAGLVYDLYKANFGKPDHALVAHAPTSVIRTDARILEQVERERRRDEENWRREFNAEFLDVDTAQFFDEPTIEKALDADLRVGAPPRPLDEVTVGADFGFARNSSTLAIAHRTDRVYRIAEIVEERPERGKPLVPSQVVTRFAAIVRQHVARDGAVMADGHYRESVLEHLRNAGLMLRDAPPGAAGKAESYVRCRTLMREGRLRIPSDARLLAQLRAVVARPLAGGGLAVSSPTSGDGAHGDLVSALVLVAWQAYGAKVPEAKREETEAQRIEREEDERVAALTRRLEDRQRKGQFWFSR